MGLKRSCEEFNSESSPDSLNVLLFVWKSDIAGDGKIVDDILFFVLMGHL